ncbi:MAG: hypothetical protein ACRC14_02285 [Paracoccaceae bacterium]
MNLGWLMRMSQWARNPPPLRKVLLVLAVIGVCIAIWGFEQIWGWPEWLTVNGRLRGH